MPLVSVIVNAYNGAKTLSETLDSIFAQTFTDFEVIFWDDASSDDTAMIAGAYASHRVKYFRSPGSQPLGLGAVRQAAIHVACGEWIAFVDQDDIWLPRNLERQMSIAMSDSKIGMVYGRAVRFWPDGQERDFDKVNEYRQLPEGNLFEQLWVDCCFICISASIMRREAVHVAGEIPSEITIVPDYFLYLGIARHWQVRAVQEVVCRYRMHLGNTTLRTRMRMQVETLLLIDRWQHETNPGVARRRRRVHSTVLAVEELRRQGDRIAGLRRLLYDGSLLFLLSRPLVWAGRSLRRRFWRPFWQRHGFAK